MRYTLQLSGNTSINSQNSQSTFDYDLRKLLPSHLKDKNLIMSSSFHTTGIIPDGNETMTTEDLLLHYKFEDQYGLGLYDEVSQTYNATMTVNGASLDPLDYIVGASSLLLESDNSGYVTLPAFTISAVGFAISFWFKNNSTPSNGTRLLVFSPNATANIFSIYFNNNVLSGIARDNSANIILNPAFSNTNYPDDQWHHFVLNIDVYGHWYSYVDGVLTYSYTATDAYPTVLNRTHNFIGSNYTKVAPFYDGNVDDLRIYNRVLTTSDIFLLSNSSYSLLSVSCNIPSVYSYSPTAQSLTPLGHAVPKNAYKLDATSNDSFIFSYQEGHKYNIHYKDLPSYIVVNVSNSTQPFLSTYPWILNLFFFDE